MFVYNLAQLLEYLICFRLHTATVQSELTRRAKRPRVLEKDTCHIIRLYDLFAILDEGRAHTSPMTALNPLNPELNPICHLLALLGAHHFLHVSRIRVKLLTLRRLMLYMYMEHPFLMFLDHTQRRSTVGRTPLDE